MNPAVEAMLAKYQCQSRNDYENALKEIIQEIALLGLWRSKFFEHAAFYGGTSLRILYGLNRFSEDIDFSLLEPNKDFEISPYLRAIETELRGMDFNVEATRKEKSIETTIESAFIKAGTKELLLQIEMPKEIIARVARNDVLKIKLEIDTDPPGRFETEVKTLLQPMAFSVKSFKLSDLFAGKIHAILQRSMLSGRVKGRDFFDFVWYVGRGTPVHLEHLEERLRQTGGWKEERPLTINDARSLLAQKFLSVDFESAKKDIQPFIADQEAIALWSNQFFVDLSELLNGC